MSYLEEAKKLLAMVKDGADPEEVTALVTAQCATAYAQVAQAELMVTQTELLRALIERIDAVTVPIVGGESALQTFTYTQGV